MGLRGWKPNKFIESRNRRVWREYLLMRVLAYYSLMEIYRRVSMSVGIAPENVATIVTMTSPDGCYADAGDL